MSRPSATGRRARRIPVFAAALLLAAGAADARPPHPEEQLEAAVEAMQDGDLAGASHRLEALLKLQPNFRLANLLYSRVLALRSGKPLGLPQAGDDDPRLKDLIDELHARTDPARALPGPGLVPDVLLRLAAEVRHALVVDLSKARLYVVENPRSGPPRVIRSYYAGIARNGFGKQASGDLRTPVGVYQITGWTPGTQLPPLYGAGAFPMNYPNSWDRGLGKSGYGIWLHGVPPNTYARPPRSSEGCVTLANEDLLALQPMIDSGNTPVILADRLAWLPAARLAGERNTLLRALDSWRRKWGARDTDGYLRHYAADFRSGDGLNRVAFRAQQQRLAGERRKGEVQLSELSLFEYPGEPNLVLAQFVQNLRSGKEHSSQRMDQYWRRQAGGDWKIVREEIR